MGFILFLLMLANTVAAIYSTALTMIVVVFIVCEFKAQHPEWEFHKDNTLKEKIEAIAMCLAIFLCPLLNVSFAHFCMDHYSELKTEIFKLMEKELPAG